LNIGASAINNFSPGLINPTTKYYEVAYNYETIRVNLYCDSRYDTIPLHFINAWGMFDTALFNLSSRLTMDVERKAFTQRDYVFNPTTVDYYDENNVYREGKINYGGRASHNMKLTMASPTDIDYQWLHELLLSPQVYTKIDGYYYPVTIKTSNYEYSTIQNNKLRPFEIDIELNQPRYAHQR
jgi:hypothetical protein